MVRVAPLPALSVAAVLIVTKPEIEPWPAAVEPASVAGCVPSPTRTALDPVAEPLGLVTRTVPPEIVVPPL